MMRNFKAFSQLGETGMLGPFAVNVAKFGSLPDAAPTSGPNKAYKAGNLFSNIHKFAERLN
ncbi:MAG: hypothetical protein ACPG7P_04660 [Candidatus Puniceispirillaceae bacterium]|jgi:hypothetical protein